MTVKDWDKMGKIGYGDYFYQEYSLDEPGYVYVQTSNTSPQLPVHLGIDPASREVVLFNGHRNMDVVKYKLIVEKQEVPKPVTKSKINDWGDW